MPAPEPSTFNLPTFVVAAIGAVTGLLSAAWAVVPYVSAGAKIRVRIKYVFAIGKGPVLAVDAYNRRRGTVGVTNWGIAYYGRRHKDGLVFLGNSTSSQGDSGRTTVQGLHSASWSVLARELVVFEVNEKKPVAIRAIVELGNDKQVWSKPLKLPAGSLHQVPRVLDDDE